MITPKQRRRALPLAALISLLCASAVCRTENAAPTAPPLKLAFVGASITAGYGTANPAQDSYPAQLARMLGERWHVRNCGVSGATLIHSGDLPYVSTDAYKQVLALKPDVLVIDLGGNDSKTQNFEAHSQDFVPDYRAMVETFRRVNPNIKIYAAQPVPAFPGNYGIRDSVIIGKIMPAILQAATETHISVIDLHTPLVNRAADFADKVHPNEAGAKIIAEVIFSVLKKDFVATFATERQEK